jgi:hypothetical protein
VVGLPCVVSDIGGLGDGDLTPSPLRKVADMVNPWLGLISELTTKRSSFPLGNVGEGEESCGRGRSKEATESADCTGGRDWLCREETRRDMTMPTAPRT